MSGTPDNTINQSAYLAGSPFDLTGGNYSCTSADGRTKLAWDGTTLTIKGTVFIDGSARSTSGNAKYVGKGTIILERALLDGQQHATLREQRLRRR